MTDATMMLGATGEIRKHTGWFIALGIVFIVGGVLAIAMPLLASLTVAIVVGWSLFIVGVVTIVGAWSIRTWGGFAWQLVIGIIFVLGGLSMALNPLSGAITLALVLGVVFIAKGVAQLILGYRFRPHQGWGWIIGSGVLAVIVGLMILSAWPFSGAWVPGTLAGISLIFSGWSYIMIALAARRLAT
ncbi:MAG: HdeD family acid-resistance protein [Bauldia sp.]